MFPSTSPNLHAAIDNCAFPYCYAACVGYWWGTECAVQVQPFLHGHLQGERHAEDFMSHALFGRWDAFREDVAETEESFAEMVVGAREIEERQGERVEWGRGGCGGEACKYVGLEARREGIFRLLGTP